MYSVARFAVEPHLLEQIAALGESMNGVRPGVYGGLRPLGDGFSCNVSSEGEWEAHVRDMARFVAEFREHIGRARGLGASVSVDLAIEPDDRESARAVFGVAFPGEFLMALANAGMSLEVTVY